MSTKIYTGFKIDTPNIFEVLEIVKAFRTVLQPLVDQKFIEFYNNTIKETMGRKIKVIDAWFDLVNLSKSEGTRIPQVDTQFQLVLFPHKEDQCFYGMVFHDSPVWFDLWVTQPKVSYFGYWNNTDRDEENCTEEQWEHRSKVWNYDIFDEIEIPSMVGFSIEVSPTGGPNIFKLLHELTKEALST